MRSNARRLGVTVVVAAALLSLAACGGNSNVPSANHPLTHVKVTQQPVDASAKGNDPSASIPSSLPTVPTKADGSPDYCAGQAKPSGPVAESFGIHNVQAAYCEMVAFTLDDSTWTDSLLSTEATGLDPVQFSFVKDYMTARAQDAWDRNVKAAIAKDATAQQNVEMLTFYGLNDPASNFEVAPSGPLVQDKKFSPATLGSDTQGPGGADRLSIQFTVSADVRMVLSGKNVLFPMQKTITYALIPNADPAMPWVIDSYSGSFHTDPPKPVS